MLKRGALVVTPFSQLGQFTSNLIIHFVINICEKHFYNRILVKIVLNSKAKVKNFAICFKILKHIIILTVN